MSIQPFLTRILLTALVAFVSFSGIAHAKQFYQTRIKMKVSYGVLGRSSVSSDELLVFDYSDEFDVCEVTFAGKKERCRIESHQESHRAIQHVMVFVVSADFLLSQSARIGLSTADAARFGSPDELMIPITYAVHKTTVPQVDLPEFTRDVITGNLDSWIVSALLSNQESTAQLHARGSDREAIHFVFRHNPRTNTRRL